MSVTAWFASVKGWQAALVAFAAGSLMALGFAPFHLWPVLFISLPILYLLLEASTSYRQVLARGFFFGYGHAMAGTWWIANALLVDAKKFGWMLPISVGGLSAVMALWFVVFALLAYALRRQMNLLLFTALWVAVEYLRSIGMFGFPWNLTGYMALAYLPLAQVAAVVGTYGLSLLLVTLGLLPILWLRSNRRLAIRATACALMMLAALIISGVDRLHEAPVTTQTQLRVVQPVVPQEVKGTKEGQLISAKLLGDYSTRLPKEKKLDVTIWPETAYPYTVRATNAHPLPDLQSPVLLTGAVRAEGMKPDVQLWNSFVALDSDGRILAGYDKHQLVPFGEFMPLRTVLPLDKVTPGDIDFSRGPGPQTITIEHLPPFSPLICYEVIFPWMVVDQKHRPAWLLNVTNDGWYGVSPGPYQHFDAARMRAIEQGLPMVRVANNGISAVMDARGLIIGSLLLNQRGILDLELPGARDTTSYARYGESPVLITLIVILFFSFVRVFKNQK